MTDMQRNAIHYLQAWRNHYADIAMQRRMDGIEAPWEDYTVEYLSTSIADAMTSEDAAMRRVSEWWALGIGDT